MSFVFRGSRADVEAGGFPGFAPERRAMRIHAAGRPVNSNSLAFLVTVLVLFMLLNSHQMPPNFLLWLVLGVFLMATSLRMYATCQQLQGQAQAHAAAANGFLGHTELRVQVPPAIAFATRGRLQSLRLQLALLDREFDDLDYDALRALDADNSPHAPSMSEEEINYLPVFKYKVQAQQGSASARKNDGPSQTSVSSTGSGNEKKQDHFKGDGTGKTPDDELTCSVCLEQVVLGDLLRSLPCLHQFHANCIDPWLRQKGTCPVCKHRVSDGWHGTVDGEVDASYMHDPAFGDLPIPVSGSGGGGGGGGKMVVKAAEAEAAEEAASTNQHAQSFNGCRSEKFYHIESPHKKRKSQYELSHPRLSSLKYKFQNRLTWQEDESSKTESLGCGSIFFEKNCDMDMVNVVEELESCDNTRSLFGGCIEVDSINGIESQKMLKVQASSSSSSSNNISSDAFTSSRSSGTKDTDSWDMQHLEYDHPALMRLPYDDDIEETYDVLRQYDSIMKNDVASGDVDDSAARIIDEKLYTNGIDDVLIFPRGQNDFHGEKNKLTIDQEFEQYFSRLML
ncbi:hypothetical protein GUJ93_ZPchr0006g43969 [Zizania palustris]|uniref:RING-type E3 ubiquitin transferase n=1 Tax=Zizania palustris TaxID=103762 RepID=A0A8J5SRB2_ZIZPA|nr:hypothetical protein GUJ93_ZPchr0006g43969 [Zizania palustris]